MKEALLMLGFGVLWGCSLRLGLNRAKNRPRVPHWGICGLGWRRLNLKGGGSVLCLGEKDEAFWGTRMGFWR